VLLSKLCACHLTFSRDRAAYKLVEEEEDAFLLHKINVKSVLASCDSTRSRSPAHEYPPELIDHTVSQYVGGRHNAIVDTYAEEVSPVPLCPLLLSVCFAMVHFQGCRKSIFPPFSKRGKIDLPVSLRVGSYRHLVIVVLARGRTAAEPRRCHVPPEIPALAHPFFPLCFRAWDCELRDFVLFAERLPGRRKRRKTPQKRQFFNALLIRRFFENRCFSGVLRRFLRAGKCSANSNKIRANSKIGAQEQRGKGVCFSIAAAIKWRATYAMIPSIFQMSVFIRGFAAFSAHLHALGKQLKFRATRIPGRRNRGKREPEGRNGTSGGARQCGQAPVLAAHPF